MSESPTPQLRPLGIGEILDVAVNITVRHWWTLARAVLVVVVPLQAVSAIIDVSAGGGIVTSGETETIEEDELWTYVAAALLAAVLLLLAQTLATGVCFQAVADAYLGRSPSWRRSLAEVLRRLHSILWVSFLTYLFGFLALLALIVPGVWLFVAWTVAVPALLMEGTRGTDALGRSFRLVRHFWWRTLAIILLGSILAGVIQTALTAVFAGLALTGDSAAVELLAVTLAAIVAAAVTTPFIAAATIVLYIDLRVRKEGFDLALLAARFGEPERGETPLVPPPPPPVLPRSVATGGAQPPYWPPPPGWKPEE